MTPNPESVAPSFERLLPWIRAQFPQVAVLSDGRPRCYLDNAAGTLVPQTVADAMAEAAVWANPQPGRAWPGSEETGRDQKRTRAMLADFLNAGEDDRIYVSESTTASLYKLREALEPQWGPDDNLVVTDGDHFANISPWEWRARWQVRRAAMLPDGHLDLDSLSASLDARTRVVALSLAGNGLGTVARLEAAIPLVRERAPDAVLVVDAVHGAPHLPIDVRTLGADALGFSTYKLFGPLAGVLWIGGSLADRLDPYHVSPHTDPVTLMEWGTLDNVRLAGIRAALGYLQRLGERLEPAMVGRHAGYPRGRRLYKVALSGIRDYEETLSRRVLAGWQDLPRVRGCGVLEPERAAERVPTFAFKIDGVGESGLERALWERGGLQVADSDHYSAAILRGLGLTSLGRASFAHYNRVEDAEAFLDALARVSGTRGA